MGDSPVLRAARGSGGASTVHCASTGGLGGSSELRTSEEAWEDSLGTVGSQRELEALTCTNVLHAYLEGALETYLCLEQ